MDHNELDLLTAITPSVFYGSPTRLSTRQKARPEATYIPTESTKRKRTGNNEDAEKKRKIDEKKAATIRQNERKDARDTAMKGWLNQNYALLAPLLPSSTHLLEAVPCASKPYPFHALHVQPSLIKGGEMKDYQLHGLSFLAYMYRNGMNAILGDEMGLGKTLQTLSLFAYIQEHSSVEAPHLVICPLSVLSSWEGEARRWLPSFRVLRYHGTAPQRTHLKKSFRESAFDLVITTYDSFLADDEWFKSHRWVYCVLDEGHKIKNSTTQIARKVQGLGSMYRLILTGTPVQNDLSEVWGLFHYLYPTVFTERTQANFINAFNLALGMYDVPFLGAVQRFLAAIMLRRTKDTVALDLPPREELTVFIPLSESQRFWTYRLLNQMDAVDLEAIFDPSMKVGDVTGDQGRREVLKNLQADLGNRGAGEKQLWQRLNFILMQLQRLCDHPYLIPDAEPEPYIPGEHLIASSSKLIAIDKILADVLPKGEQVLIFSQWTGMLDILSDFLRLRNIPFARLDGSTLRPRRTLYIKLFQRENSLYKVFLISTNAGGLGINLTKASTVIMTDSSWNPQNDLQAIARAHRIGQEKIVKVYRLICRGSVEDQMLDRIRRKLFLSLKVMDAPSESSSDSSGNLGLNELRDILRKGSSALESKAGINLASFLNAPFSEILEASRDRVATDVTVKEGEVVAPAGSSLSAEEEERQLLSGVAQVKTRLFEGTMIEKIKAMDTVDELVGKRARTTNIVKLSGMEYVVGKLTPDEVQERAEKRHALAMAQKVKKEKHWENEDYCIHCRDGGDVVMCEYCPRVFHAECAQLTPKDLKKPFLKCSQHNCWDCGLSTTEAGGMLFRCQTCVRALCEECVAEQPTVIGEVLPEFQLLGYGASAAAFYIQCDDCLVLQRTEPLWWETTWGQDLRESRMKLAASQGAKDQAR